MKIKKVISSALALLLALVLTAGLVPTVMATNTDSDPDSGTTTELRPWEKNDDGYYYSAKPDRTMLTKTEGVTCRGIDVSHWNLDIDWAKIYEQYQAGTISFVIVRCGYGSDLVSQDDRYWKANADACAKYGIPFGVYIYSHALNVEDAKSEAAHVLRLIEGYTLSYPIYYDVEDTKTQSDISGKDMAEIVDTFCGILQDKGYEVGFYSMYNWIASDKHLGLVDYKNKNYSLWIAQFNNTLNFDDTYDMWQCTSSASIDGVPSKRVDVSFSMIPERTLDHCYLTFDLCGREGTVPKPMHVERGSAYGTLPTVTSTSGEHIIGWYTEPEGGELVTAESIVAVNGKQRLYARWACAFELKSEGLKVSGGDVKQTVSSDNKFAPLTLTAEEGYYLPTRVDVPEGYVYTRTSETTATITGTPVKDAVVTVKAIPNGQMEPPCLSDFKVYPSSFAANDGKITGVTSGMEIKTSAADWRAVTAAEEKDGVLSLGAGEVQIRYAGKDGKQASSVVTVKVLSQAENPDASKFQIIQPTTKEPTGTVVLPDAGYEYSTDGGKTFNAVAESGRVEGLAQWKKVWIRRAANSEYAASEAVSVDVAPMLTSKVFNYYSCCLITRTAGAELLVDGEKFNTDDMGYLNIEEKWYGKTVKIQLAALADDVDAVTVEVAIPARPAAPDCIVVKNETRSGKNDGSITGYTANMQYSTTQGKTWTTVTQKMVDDGIKFEYEHEYWFRQTSSSEDSFPSLPFVAKISRGEKIKVTFVAEGSENIVLEADYGKTVAMPELPKLSGCDMEKSHWDKDLTGVELTEDVTVTAVYEKTGCGAVLAVAPTFAALSLAALMFIRRRNRGSEEI